MLLRIKNLQMQVLLGTELYSSEICTVEALVP